MKQPARRESDHFHAVRFYEDERSLYRIVADFVGDGLVAGQPAVIIATPSHREEIARGLHALSLDVSGLRASGELLMLDAEEMLSTFMKDGFPDGAAFRQNVGALLDSATAGRPRTTGRAEGEMVDCRWKSDETIAAIQLEVSGISWRIRRPFRYCAGIRWGISTNMARPSICDQHTHVMSAAGQPCRIRCRLRKWISLCRYRFVFSSKLVTWSISVSTHGGFSRFNRSSSPRPTDSLSMAG